MPAELEETWAGLIDVTPDSNPVIDQINQLPGLTIATGFFWSWFWYWSGSGTIGRRYSVELDTAY